MNRIFLFLLANLFILYFLVIILVHIFSFNSPSFWQSLYFFFKHHIFLFWDKHFLINFILLNVLYRNILLFWFYFFWSSSFSSLYFCNRFYFVNFVLIYFSFIQILIFAFLRKRRLWFFFLYNFALINFWILSWSSTIC